MKIQWGQIEDRRWRHAMEKRSKLPKHQPQSVNGIDKTHHLQEKI